MRPIIAALTAVVALVSCGNSTTQERPGNPAVFDDIATETDCTALQETFDRAEANYWRAEPESDERGWTLEYMKAANERMVDIGC